MIPGQHHRRRRPDFDAAAEIEKAVAVGTAGGRVVMVLGEQQDMIGEVASRSSLELPGRQQELLDAVVATGKPVVLVLMSGRPLDLRAAAAKVPGDPRHLVPGYAGRDRGRQPAVRRRGARRQASVLLAAPRRARCR